MSLKKRKEKKSVLCAQCMLAWPAVHSFKHRLFNTSCSQEIMCKGVCYTRWHRRNCSHHVPPNVGFTLNITGIKPTVCPIYLFIFGENKKTHFLFWTVLILLDCKQEAFGQMDHSEITSSPFAFKFKLFEPNLELCPNIADFSQQTLCVLTPLCKALQLYWQKQTGINIVKISSYLVDCSHTPHPTIHS